MPSTAIAPSNVIDSSQPETTTIDPVAAHLRIRLGQCSSSGIKPVNQDCYGALIPDDTALKLKGAAIVLADGISSSQVSQVASETAVKSFLSDYYATPDSWSVKKSAQRVLNAINAWLHSQTKRSDMRFEMDKGYVCTFSALVLKSNTAHLFHVGDSRIYQLHPDRLEQLTQDHRLVISKETSYLSRALGFDCQLDLDITSKTLQQGDLFLLTTDGVHDYLDHELLTLVLQQHPNNLDAAAHALVEHALARGSTDNLTVQLVEVVQLPEQSASELLGHATSLPPAPLLEAPCVFEGFHILRELHANSRSHVYLAQVVEESPKAHHTPEKLVLKVPSIDLRDNPHYLERFLLEEWVARRIKSPHVVKAAQHRAQRYHLYTLMEYIEGQSLNQWRVDNPKASLEQIRCIIEQVARGLQSFHRLEMLHQDIRPENILIDSHGTVKIIDFGSTYVAGLAESAVDPNTHLMGTALYAAPEYFLGEAGSTRSDQFSLAVLTYFLISGRYPYGLEVAKARSRSAQLKLSYQSVLDGETEIPAWVDVPLRKALQPDPYKRFEEISEFIHALKQPSPQYLSRSRPPLLERNPVAFWQLISFCLFCLLIGVTFFR